MQAYYPKGLDIVSRILSKPAPFLIYSDPDIDGAVAGELTIRVMKAFNKPYQIYINQNRRHGLDLTETQVQQLKGYTIILVDAGMTREELVYLTDNSINIINIDHHHLDYDELVHVKSETTGAEGVIINNQYPFEPSGMRFLSGAGMVYYVFRAMFPNLYTNDEVALVGLTLLSDIRSLDDQLARDFLYVTYTHKSPYMDYLVKVAKPEKDYGFGTQTFDRNFIDFTFSPRINALFRLNKGYEALQVFEGTYVNNGQLDVYRNIQNSIQDTILQNLQGDTYSNIEFKFVDSNLPLPYDYEITNFVGLSCSKHLREGKTTIIFVRENGVVKRGSLRGICDDVDYLSIIRKHGIKAEGHHNACGVTYVDFETLDVEALNNEIAEHEKGYEQRKYAGRIIPVANLNLFLRSEAEKYADWNNYVRTNKRIYVQYTGSKIESEPKGKAMNHIIDGVKVLSFSHDLQVKENLIMPVKERGGYTNFYLQKY